MKIKEILGIVMYTLGIFAYIFIIGHYIEFDKVGEGIVYVPDSGNDLKLGEILGVLMYILGIFAYIFIIGHYLKSKNIGYILGAIVSIIFARYFFGNTILIIFGYNIPIYTIVISILIIVILISYIYFNRYKSQEIQGPIEKPDIRPDPTEQSNIRPDPIEKPDIKQDPIEHSNIKLQSGIREDPLNKEVWKFLLNNFSCNLPDDMTCIKKIAKHFDIPESRASDIFESDCEQFLKERK